MNKSELDTLINQVNRKFSGFYGVFKMLLPTKSTELECALWWLSYKYGKKTYVAGCLLKSAFCLRFNLDPSVI